MYLQQPPDAHRERHRGRSFTPFYSYPAGSTVGSASGGIQETLNAACGGSDHLEKQPVQCNDSGKRTQLTETRSIPITGRNDYRIQPVGAERLWNVAELQWPRRMLADRRFDESNDYQSNTILGLSFRSPTNLSSNPAFAGRYYADAATSHAVTITTAGPMGSEPATW